MIIYNSDRLECQIKNAEIYQWLYQQPDNKNLCKINSSTEFCKWFGFGTYYCIVSVNKQMTTYSYSFIENTEIKQNIELWDFSKIPENLINLILDLIDNENWKALLFIHNEYKISSNKFCCGLFELKEKFIEYASMLRNRK